MIRIAERVAAAARAQSKREYPREAARRASHLDHVRGTAVSASLAAHDLPFVPSRRAQVRRPRLTDRQSRRYLLTRHRRRRRLRRARARQDDDGRSSGVAVRDGRAGARPRRARRRRRSGRRVWGGVVLVNVSRRDEGWRGAEVDSREQVYVFYGRQRSRGGFGDARGGDSRETTLGVL